LKEREKQDRTGAMVDEKNPAEMCRIPCLVIVFEYSVNILVH